MKMEKHYHLAIGATEDAINRIAEINDRLYILADKIKKSQGEYGGSVTLHLYPCGKDCLGCPHPRWRKWFLRKKDPSRSDTILLSTVIDNPLKRLRVTGEHAKTLEQTKMLVKEAVDLIEKKKKLVEAISNINRLTALTRKASPNPGVEENTMI